MSLLYQTDSRLRQPFAIYGCELLCTMAIACRYVGTYLDPEKVNWLLDYFMNHDIIDSELSVCHDTSPWRILRDTFHALGFPNLRGTQVGSICSGVVTFWTWYNLKSFNYAIHRGYTLDDTPHSVLLNRDLQEIYNPHPFVRIAKRGPMYLYRVKPLTEWDVPYGE